MKLSVRADCKATIYNNDKINGELRWDEKLFDASLKVKSILLILPTDLAVEDDQPKAR